MFASISTGTKPFFVELFLKIGPNRGEITASNPACCIAQTACSRDEPVPKFGVSSDVRGQDLRQSLVVGEQLAERKLCHVSHRVVLVDFQIRVRSFHPFLQRVPFEHDHRTAVIAHVVHVLDQPLTRGILHDDDRRQLCGVQRHEEKAEQAKSGRDPSPGSAHRLLRLRSAREALEREIQLQRQAFNKSFRSVLAEVVVIYPIALDGEHHDRIRHNNCAPNRPHNARERSNQQVEVQRLLLGVARGDQHPRRIRVVMADDQPELSSIRGVRPPVGGQVETVVRGEVDSHRSVRLRHRLGNVAG